MVLTVAKTRSPYHTVNRKRLSQRLRRAYRKPRRRSRSRRRSSRLGCLNSLFNAYLSLGNHVVSDDILHSSPAVHCPAVESASAIDRVWRLAPLLEPEPDGIWLSVARRTSPLAVPSAVGLYDQALLESFRQANKWVPRQLSQPSVS